MLRNEHQNYDCSLDELRTTDTVAVWTLPGHRIDHRRQAPFHHPYPEDEDDDLLDTPPPQHCDMKTKLRIYFALEGTTMRASVQREGCAQSLHTSG